MKELQPKIVDLYKNSNSGIPITLEFFIPHENGEYKIEKAYEIIEKTEKIFFNSEISKQFNLIGFNVTCGRTADPLHTVYAVWRGQSIIKRPGVVHVTCAKKSRQQLEDLANYIYDMGIPNVLLARGDTDSAGEKFKPRSDGYCYGYQLVELYKRLENFCVEVPGYPDPHHETLLREKNRANAIESDLDNLQKKIDMGADCIITQGFFDRDCNVFFDYVDKVRERGIRTPIIPGIMLMKTPSGVRFISQRCEIPLHNFELTKCSEQYSEMILKLTEKVDSLYIVTF